MHSFKEEEEEKNDLQQPKILLSITATTKRLEASANAHRAVIEHVFYHVK